MQLATAENAIASFQLDLRTLSNQCRRLRMACEADVGQPPAVWTALGREILATFLRGQRLMVQVQASMVVAAGNADSPTYADRRHVVGALQLVMEQLSNLRLIANARLWQAQTARSGELVRG